MLAWACGPARHLFAFADVGIAGIGADAGKAMVAYARRIAGPRRSGSAEVTFVRADLDEKPKVPRASLPVDLSFVAFSGIHPLGNAKDIEKHLKLAASLLAPGGVHVIEATHPSDLTAAGVSHTAWTEMVGDKVIDARFRMHVERMSPERVVPVSLEVSYAVKGAPAATAQKPQPSLRQDGEWFIPDLAGWRSIVGAVPDFTLAAALGDFNVEVPFEHQSAWRLILVLKRV